MRLGAWVAALLGALLVGAAGPAPALEGPALEGKVLEGPALEGKVRAFFERPEQMDAVRDVVIRQAASLPRACEGLQFRPVEFLMATPPTPRFDAAGMMVEGRVRQRFASGGCGTFAPLFNVWTIAAPGEKLRTFTSYPGTSSASVDAQHDATPTVTVAAGRVAGGCGSLEVIDTRDIGLDASPGTGVRSWREAWLVGGCGMYATVLLHFVPGPDGRVAAEVPPDGVRRVALR